MSDEHSTTIGKKTGKKHPWTPEEDLKLVNYINRFGIWNWVYIPKYAGLSRSGKSCRLRWLNYLNPNIKRGNYSQEEDEIIIHMRQFMGAGWAAIAEKLAGRTDNEIKNRWHTHLKKQLYKNLPTEIVESKIDTASKCDNNCKYISPATTSTSNHELPNIEEVLVGQEVSDSSNIFDSIDSDMSNSPVLEATHDIQMIDIEQPSIDPFQKIEHDPLEIFWRKPFLVEYDHLQTNYVQYPDQMITMSTPDWYKEPMSPFNYWPDSCYNYSF